MRERGGHERMVIIREMNANKEQQKEWGKGGLGYHDTPPRGSACALSSPCPPLAPRTYVHGRRKTSQEISRSESHDDSVNIIKLIIFGSSHCSPGQFQC